MTKLKMKTIEQFKLHVNVTSKDIHEGECRSPTRCMEKVAIERALRDIDSKGGDHRVRVDGGQIKFNLGGFKYSAITPKPAKSALIQFDREERAKNKAQKAGMAFVSKVKPHGYNLECTKGSKIILLTPDRQKQINEARRRRIAAGHPDKTRYTLHQRVIGMGNV
jgi:hypothetical protein